MDNAWTDLVRTLSDKDIQAFIVLVLVVGMILVYYSVLNRGHRGEGMSRAQRRERRKAIEEGICDTVTAAMEEAVRKGETERSDADAFYAKLRKIGYKEVGPEPTFGRPWYSPDFPLPVPSPGKVKKRLSTAISKLKEARKENKANVSLFKPK